MSRLQTSQRSSQEAGYVPQGVDLGGDDGVFPQELAAVRREHRRVLGRLALQRVQALLKVPSLPTHHESTQCKGVGGAKRWGMVRGMVRGSIGLRAPKLSSDASQLQQNTAEEHMHGNNLLQACTCRPNSFSISASDTAGRVSLGTVLSSATRFTCRAYSSVTAVFTACRGQKQSPSAHGQDRSQGRRQALPKAPQATRL